MMNDLDDKKFFLCRHADVTILNLTFAVLDGVKLRGAGEWLSRPRRGALVICLHVVNMLAISLLNGWEYL